MTEQHEAVHGAIACGHPDTSEAAASILREGGTAFDAGIAAVAAACVAEPVLAALTGGGYALAAGAQGEPRLFDFFVATPGEQRPTESLDFRALEADFGDEVQIFHGGSGTCAVPGVIDGLFAMHAALASLPMRTLLEPAIQLARRGVVLRPFDASMMRIIERILLATPASAAFFGDPHAPPEAPRAALAGHRFEQPTLADLLDAISREGRDLFYRGDAGAAFIDFLGPGGQLTRADLEAYATEVRAPLRVDIGAATLFTNPPPAAGGAMVALLLDLVHAARRRLDQFGSSAHVRLLSEAMAVAEAARGASGDMRALASPALRHTCAERLAAPGQARRGTTHVSIADASGRLFSATLSNGTGSGQYAPSLGLIPNNMLGEADLNPGGFQQWPTASRLVSMMAPSVVFFGAGATPASKGRGVAIGSGGSSRIRSAVAQVLVNVLQYGHSVEEAVAAPRLHFEQGHLSLEPGFARDACANLPDAVRSYKQWTDQSMFFGGVHTASCGSRGLHTAPDARRSGVGQRV